MCIPISNPHFNRKSTRYQPTYIQYIPYPATWLNGKRWEDECEVQNGKDNENYEMPKTKAEWLKGFVGYE